MWNQRRINKYNNRRTRYNGRIYDSALEGSEAQNLNLRKKAGDIKDWEPQVLIELRPYGELWRKYRADFIVTHNDESLEIIETKGFWTEGARQKWRMLEILCDKKILPYDKLTVVKR